MRFRTSYFSARPLQPAQSIVSRGGLDVGNGLASSPERVGRKVVAEAHDVLEPLRYRARPNIAAVALGIAGDAIDCCKQIAMAMVSR
jgi:hypothetical protein